MIVRDMALFIWSYCRCLLAQAGAAQNEQQCDYVSKVRVRLHNTNTIFLFAYWFTLTWPHGILQILEKLLIPKPKIKYAVKQNWICANDVRYLSLRDPFHICLVGPGFSVKNVIWLRAMMDSWGLLTCFILVKCVQEDTFFYWVAIKRSIKR